MSTNYVDDVAHWQPAIRAGSVMCDRCGDPIGDADWQLEHVSYVEGYSPPRHRVCCRHPHFSSPADA